MPTTTSTLYNTSTVTYDQSTLSYDGYDGTIPTMPALGVFIAWTDTPYTYQPAWTDITNYVRSINIRRGRQNDTAAFPTGTASVTLDNRQRLFDPFNTSGANYANLKPRRQIKITAIWNSVEYVVYRGYVSGWPVEYTDAGFDSTVTIECFDLMALVGAEIINRRFIDDYILSLGPANYFPMSETPADNTWYDRLNQNIYYREQGTTVLFPGGGSTTLPYTSSSFYQVDPLKPAVASSALGCTIAFKDLPIYASTTYVTPTAADFSISIVIDVPSSGASTSYFQMVGSNGVYVEVNTGGNIKAYHSYGAGSTTTGGDIRDRQGVHVVVSYSVSTNKFTIYVNGDAGVTGSAAGSTVGYLPVTGNSTSGGGNYFIYANHGTKFQSVSFYGRQITQTEAYNMSQAYLGKWYQTTRDRALYYLTGTGVPASFYNISTSIVSDVNQVSVDASPLLPALQELVRSEGGELFVDRTGILQFFSKDDVFSTTRCNTPRFTLTDTGTGVYYDESSVRLQINADDVRNDITVIGTDKMQTNAIDATSVSQNGVAAETVETLLANEIDTAVLANRLLTVYKNPKPQIDPITVKGQKDSAYTWQRLLPLELLDRVTFKRTPSVGSAVQRDMLVQSIEHRITPETWETVINGSTRFTGWFIVGVSLIGGDDLLL